MSNLVINDLDHSAELDRTALKSISGGAFPGLLNVGELFSNITNVNGKIDNETIIASNFGGGTDMRA